MAEAAGIGMPRVLPGTNKNMDAPSSGSTERPEGEDEDRRLSGDEQEQLIRRAQKRFTQAESAESDLRAAEASDDDFYLGNQWSEDEQRERRGPPSRPMLTINILPVAVRQVTNDQRMNRMGISCAPTDEGAEQESARYLSDYIRQLEHRCNADIAYDTGFEAAARRGRGFFRFDIEFESQKSFRQVPVIRRIMNPSTVYLDPLRTDPTGRDCRFGFISEWIDRADFKDDYPDADPIDWPQRGGDAPPYIGWCTPDQVRIAEYFERETVKTKLLKLSNGHIGYQDEIDPRAFRGNKIVESRDAERHQWHWYKLTAKQVLEHAPWIGSSIPIVLVVGDELNVNGKHYSFGIVRQAKDSQRAMNYWATREAEAIALQPNSPWLAAEGTIEGYEDDYRNANRKAIPVLAYRTKDLENNPAQPPTRQPPVQIPQGYVNAKSEAAQDIKATTGVRFDPTVQPHTYDESGRALRELRRSGDLGTFHYIDNFARSLERAGEIWVDLITKLAVEPFITSSIAESGKQDLIRIDPYAPQPIGQAQHPRNPNRKITVLNPNLGHYGVTVVVGPSYATKRIEAGESMMDFGRAIGGDKFALIADIVARTQDWPEAKEIADRFARTLPPQMLVPDQKDVPPQVQALLLQLQQQLQQAMQREQQMARMLTDQTADRDQRERKNQMDFEAKILGVLQKEQAAYQAHWASQMADLMKVVKEMQQEIGKNVGA